MKSLTPATRARIRRLLPRYLGRWVTAQDRDRIVRLAALAGVPVVVRRLHLGTLDNELYGEIEVFGEETNNG